MNEFDIEYLESVCRCDNRYEEWLERHQYESMGYDVPHPSIVWTEATMLIMVLRDVNFDKQYVFKTWNNGKSDVEAYFVKSTTMYLIMHGDNRILNISSRDKERFIRDINDYEFFGKLKRKRRSRINEENGKYLEIDDSKSITYPIVMLSYRATNISDNAINGTNVSVVNEQNLETTKPI